MILKPDHFLQIGLIITLITLSAGHLPDLQQGFTTKCDELCAGSDLHLQDDLKPDCQRGCQYFNIQFLISASDKSKVTDLKTTQNECNNSCTEAYSIGPKRNACQSGCVKMTELQGKAPYINGLLVYMGAADRSMVLLQPDFDVPSEDDWVLLDSVLRSNDYDKMFDPYKFNDNRFQTMTISPVHKHLDIRYCFPTWKWMILILMLLGILWMRYMTFLNITLTETRDPEQSNTFKPSTSDKQIDENFILINDSYFYPSPVVPPPKYDEAVEAMLFAGDEEIIVGNDETGGNDDASVVDGNITVDTAKLVPTIDYMTIPKVVTTEGNSIKI